MLHGDEIPSIVREFETSSTQSEKIKPVTKSTTANDDSTKPNLAERIDHVIGWWRLPTQLGLAVVVGLRNQLRRHNLIDTGRGPHAPMVDPVKPDESPMVRTLDGTGNDVDDPTMGSVGRRFGRNVPIESTWPEPDDALMEPNVREISNKLLARDEFEPARSINLLAAAWIQSQVHDWVSHQTDENKKFQVTLPADDEGWPGGDPMVILATKTDPDPSPGQPPTYVTDDTFWWDGSQIYGVDKEFAEAIRTGVGGMLDIDEFGLPPREAEDLLGKTGNAGNSWVGLALVQSLFMREHNAICKELAKQYPRFDDQQLYDHARLINSALMAKIHTVEWTPAIVAHPVTEMGLRANWFGLMGEWFAKRFGRPFNSEILFGIPGSETDHHGADFSLTEEFSAVYRMHPLMPDTYVTRSAADNRELKRYELSDLTVDYIPARLRELPTVDWLYSLGRLHPGALSLHNFPNLLRNLEKVVEEKEVDGKKVPTKTMHLDLAAIDVLKMRERGIPRYNEFRRLFRMKPVTTFEDITDNEQWAKELRQVYGHVNRVDLMVGMFAERKPPGFAFSDTAFRVFILMATRRLKSDRFLTRDFRPEVYTHAGMKWIRDTSMSTVLLRHHPELAGALENVKNPFKPWNAAAGVLLP